ncbi:MAG: acetoacetate decarboxylase family protein [Marmoricola sp.]
MTSAQPDHTAYPAAPWPMQGQLWLSLFRIAEAVDAQRPAGIYGAAFLDYEPDSPLTYSELLVARAVGSPVKGASITDIWVDSAASVAGGRELWAIPKGLCSFEHEATRRGPATRATWSASIEGRPVASARFDDASRLAPRLPFRGRTWQPGLTEGIGAGGGERTARITGSGRTLPARATWEFAPDGPLGWLAGRRSFASLRMCDFRMSFG